jgi:NCAIR mutase (PurE)-related protein
MATRVSQAQVDRVRVLAPDLLINYHDVARIVTCSLLSAPTAGGRSDAICAATATPVATARQGLVVVVAAGTTDLPVAEEAAVTLGAFGARVDRVAFMTWG